MSILEFFELPSFNIDSLTVRVFDKWPNPREEIGDTMQYENISVKPVDVSKYVEELKRRIREHDYRTFNFSEVTYANAASPTNEAGFKRFQKTAVVRYTEPDKGKADRTMHIGLSFSYALQVAEPKAKKGKL